MKSLSPSLDMSSRPIANLSAISNLTSNGFVKTSGANGTLGIDTSVYLTQVNTDSTLTGLGTGPAAPGGSSPLGVAVSTDLAWTAEQSITLSDAGTSNVQEALALKHDSTSTSIVAGFGVGLEFYGKSTASVRLMAHIESIWTVATDASRAAALDFQLVSGGIGPTSRMRIFPTGGVGINRTVDPGTGILDVASGFMKAGTEWPLTANGIPKRTAAHTYAVATAGTDYLASVNIDATLTGAGTTASALGVAVPLSLITTDAATGVTNVLTISHNTSGTPAVNMGSSILFQCEDDTSLDQTQGQIATGWTIVTHATRSSFIELKAVSGGTLMTTGQGLKLWQSRGCTLNRNVDPTVGCMDISGVYKIGGNQIDFANLATSPVSGDTLRGVSGAWSSQAPNTQHSTTTDPTGTASTAGVHCGFKIPFTPKWSGRVLVMVPGRMSNNTASALTNVQIRYGTGTAPNNGAAATGTAIGNIPFNVNIATANVYCPFTCVAIISGLTVNTAYWFDLLQVVNAGTSLVAGVTFSITEL